MKKTALLVIDFINDIVHLEGKFRDTATFVYQHQVMERANRVIAFARKNQIRPIFTKVGFSPGYLECPEHSPLFGNAKKYQALQLGTWGTEFHRNIDIQAHDLVITKHRVSAFYATALEAFLRAHQITHLLITGVSTDLAVQTTAREAHDRDYQVTLISDACGAGSLESHQFTLKELGSIAQAIDSQFLLHQTHGDLPTSS